MFYYIDYILPGDNEGEVKLNYSGITTIYKANSVIEFIEHLCLDGGSTLEGRHKAGIFHNKHSYMVPIFLGGYNNQILIPLRSMKDKSGIWVSLDYMMNHSVNLFNARTNQNISTKSWRKHMNDGILLRDSIYQY